MERGSLASPARVGVRFWWRMLRDWRDLYRVFDGFIEGVLGKYLEIIKR